MRKSLRVLGVLGALLAAAPILAPQLLAFPFSAQVGANRVWSETPLTEANLSAVLERADHLVAASPLAEGLEPQHVFLTRGGWRWRWLAAQASGTFALTRPLSDAIIVNRHDLTADAVYNGGAVGGRRTLSGTIAHETCHNLQRRRFGMTVTIVKPTWLIEGYCDFVAQESSLSDAQVAALKAAHRGHGAIVYYEGRRKVAAALGANGGDVDALFAAN